MKRTVIWHVSTATHTFCQKRYEQQSRLVEQRTGSSGHVSAWIIVIESSDTTIFANGADHGGGTRYQMMFENGSGGVIDCVFDDDSGKKDPEGDIVVFDGKWHHIVMMRRDGIHLRLYVDGVEDTGVTNHGDATIAADYDLSRTDEHNAYIGAVWHDDNNTLEKHFGGLIDEVAVWNRALTADEVSYLWNGGIGNRFIIICRVCANSTETVTSGGSREERPWQPRK